MIVKDPGQSDDWICLLPVEATFGRVFSPEKIIQMADSPDYG
jgi:hypothetical protein